jgi:hypothetical protein
VLYAAYQISAPSWATRPDAAGAGRGPGAGKVAHLGVSADGAHRAGAPTPSATSMRIDATSLGMVLLTFPVSRRGAGER